MTMPQEILAMLETEKNPTKNADAKISVSAWCVNFVSASVFFSLSYITSISFPCLISFFMNLHGSTTYNINKLVASLNDHNPDHTVTSDK